MGPGVCIYKLLSGNFNFSPILKSPWFWMGKKTRFSLKDGRGRKCAHSTSYRDRGVCVGIRERRYDDRRSLVSATVTSYAVFFLSQPICRLIHL